jgi:hypothetical protein
MVRSSLGPNQRIVSDDELLRLRTENEALRARLSRRRSIRRWLSGTLVVLTILAMVTSTVAVWARQTVYDTDRFMEVVEPALADPAFSAALGDYVADASLEALDLDARVATLLDQVDAYLSEALVDAIDPDPQRLTRLQAFDRPTLSALSPSISGALEARVVAVVERFVTSEGFQARFPDLVRQAHAGGVALITDDLAALPNVYLEGGEVRLDLVPVIIQALQEVQAELRAFLPDVTLPAPVAAALQQGREQLRDELAVGLQTQLPEDFGQLTLMTQSSLAEVQQPARQVDRLVWGIALLTLVVLAGAIAVSLDRRRTLIQFALGVVAGLVVAMLLVRRFEAALLAQVTNPDGNQAVRSLYGELAGNLRTVTVLVALVVMVIGIVAYLSGRPPWIVGLGARWAALTAPSDAGSRLDRWVAGRCDVLRIVGIAVSLAIVFAIGLELLPVLTTGALLGLYLWAITAARQRVAALEPVPSTPPGALEDLPPLGEPAAAARPPGAEDPAP